VLALLLQLAQSDFLDPSRGPDQTGGFRVDPTAFLAIFGLGLLLGVLGHLFRSKAMVALGVALVFLTTLIAPLYLALTR